MLELKNIERVLFASPAARASGACLNDQSRVTTRQIVASCGLADMADVKVAREKNVGTARSDRGHRGPRPADDRFFVLTFRHVEGVMSDDHL